MISLIACDLDGTLLEKGRLPEGTFDMIRALKAHGILFAPASGRQLGNLKRLFAPVQKEMAFISENGSLIDVQGHQEAVYFPRPMAEAIIRDIAGAGMELLISAPETCYLLSSGSKAYTDHMVYTLRNTCTIIDDPFPLADGFIKLSGYLPEGLSKIAPALQAKWAGQVHADIAGQYWLDFTLANKGTGIESLSRQLQIPLAQMAAFGDQFNDLSMLEKVGHPYLMVSGAKALQQKGFAPCIRVLDSLKEILLEAEKSQL